MGAALGVGYVTIRLLSTKGRKKRDDDFVPPTEFPMLNMEEIAKRTVARKKSFLYTRSGDSGTSQVSPRFLFFGGWGRLLYVFFYCWKITSLPC